uniref:Presenilin n=1 Tax=Ananas comosus var. bracteatus TaxID=296719 RepID=A0A6V7QDK7_ANACO|nr:unnamed protein product [Ananas comosus var. bracteatus]
MADAELADPGSVLDFLGEGIIRIVSPSPPPCSSSSSSCPSSPPPPPPPRPPLLHHLLLLIRVGRPQGRPAQLRRLRRPHHPRHLRPRPPLLPTLLPPPPLLPRPLLLRRLRLPRRPRLPPPRPPLLPPLDPLTFALLLLNLSVVGVAAVFAPSRTIPISLNQAYLVLIGVLVAYWFTLLPEWTTWALLIAMALYDLAAVLLPGGPLRLLVEIAESRDEEIPALIYEVRPVENLPRLSRRVSRARTHFDANPPSNSTPAPPGESPPPRWRWCSMWIDLQQRNLRLPMLMLL